jgi:excisionase family DNA binding protein
MADNHRSLLTVPQFADALGITVACVRRWILERKISITKVGSRLVRIPLSELDRIIEEGSRPRRQRHGDL